MIDKLDDILVVVPQIEADDSDGSEEDHQAQQILDACANFFTEISLIMRKLVDDLPPDLKGWFPEIAGGALQAQAFVILQRLKSSGDQDNERIILSLAEQLANRAMSALTANDKKNQSKRVK